MSVLPKITVVTPNYNMGAYLETTIKSVLDQAYPNLEYIIIDGGSTDSSVEIIKKYEDKLAWWVSEKDQGLYDAVQKGLNNSTGEILTYLNSDDILYPGALSIIAQIFQDYPQVSWLGGVPNHIDEEGRHVYVHNGVPRWNKYRYYLNDVYTIQQEGTFWRKDLWQQTGSYFSSTYKLAADMELWSRFFLKTPYYVLPAVTAAFRMRKSNQKSLEGMTAYMDEAKKIIAAMDRSAEDKKLLNDIKKLHYFRLKNWPVVKNLPAIKRINSALNSFPPALYFDRVAQKFKLSS